MYIVHIIFFPKKLSLFFKAEYNKVQQQLEQNYEEFKGIFGKSKDDLDESENNPFFEGSEEPVTDSTNPFDADDYDKSGKNPFA